VTSISFASAWRVGMENRAISQSSAITSPLSTGLTMS
jgi:hypothetical protein